MTTASGSAAYTRDRVTWVAFGALFGFGILNAVLGPVLPYLREALNLSYVVGALHQVGFAVGGGAAGLLVAAGRLRVSRRTTVAAGLSGAGLAGLGIGYGDSPVITVGAALLVSLFATSALISVWAVLADRHASHRAVALSEGEISVSLAGVLTPTLVGALATTTQGWRAAFLVAAVVAVAGSMSVITVGLPPAVAPAPALHGAVPRRLPPTLVTIFAVVALEFMVSFWLASYLAEDVGLTRDSAAATVAVLYAAHLVGRVVTSRVARRVPTRRLLALALLAVLAGSPLLLAAPGPGLAVIGIVVAGAGTGAAFPLASTLHVQASHLTSDGALGQTLAVAALGQIAGPLSVGALAQVTDLRTGLLMLPAFSVLAALSLPRRTPDRGSRSAADSRAVL